MTDATKIKELVDKYMQECLKPPPIDGEPNDGAEMLKTYGELHAAIDALQARCDAAEKDCRTCEWFDLETFKCECKHETKRTCAKGSEYKRVDFVPLWETK